MYHIKPVPFSFLYPNEGGSGFYSCKHGKTYNNHNVKCLLSSNAMQASLALFEIVQDINKHVLGTNLHLHTSNAHVHIYPSLIVGLAAVEGCTHQNIIYTILIEVHST